MPRPKASEPMSSFNLALPTTLRDEFVVRANSYDEVPSRLIRQFIRHWLRRHPLPQGTVVSKEDGI